MDDPVAAATTDVPTAPPVAGNPTQEAQIPAPLAPTAELPNVQPAPGSATALQPALETQAPQSAAPLPPQSYGSSGPTQAPTYGPSYAQPVPEQPPGQTLEQVHPP